MALIDYKDLGFSDVVDDYVRSRIPDGRPVSTRDAVQALRTARIRCYISDRELAEIVAATAIGYGCDVTFDWTGTEDSGLGEGPTVTKATSHEGRRSSMISTPGSGG